MQVTVDAQEMFTSVVAKWPGSVHDARVFKNSVIGDRLHQMRHDGDFHLLGDSGYGLAPYLMRPFRTSNTPAEMAFNKLLSKERVIVERVIGQMKARFPILKHAVRIKHERIPAVITACAVLHNQSKRLGELVIEEEEAADGNPPEVLEVVEEWPANIRALGTAKRAGLANDIFALGLHL